MEAEPQVFGFSICGPLLTYDCELWALTLIGECPRMHVDWNELPPRPAELKHEAVASTCAVEVPPSNKHHNGWKEMIPPAKHVPKEADTPVVNVSCMCAFIMCTRLWKDRQGSCYQWKKYFFPSLSLESKKATRSRSFIFGLSTIEEVCSRGFFFLVFMWSQRIHTPGSDPLPLIYLCCNILLPLLSPLHPLFCDWTINAATCL